MKVQQLIWDSNQGWEQVDGAESIQPQLVLFFGDTAAVATEERWSELRGRFPDAQIIGCSSAGEIIDEEVYDNSIVASAVQFDKTSFEVVSTKVGSVDESFSAGQYLGQQLNGSHLSGLLVLSEGLTVNGSELVRGLVDAVGTSVPITGGLAGDGDRFESTCVGVNGVPESGQIAAIGFYGSDLKFGHGSMGGWDAFGPQRTITRSSGSVLYELDGQPALELYKKYLGEHAEGLPGSALLFPLVIEPEDANGSDVVRTVLSVSEEDQSLTFAGDMPQGYRAQLMRANFERLIDGAGSAAKLADVQAGDSSSLAILISCVGRKMILRQRTADEVEAVKETLGDNVAQIGFYSYGEISPHASTGSCELHNQTMTITLIAES